MLLQRLVEYADTLDVPPPMYGPVPVKYVVELDQKGNFQGISVLDGGRKTNDRGKTLQAPTLTRSSGIKPKLLVDNGEYVVGVGREDSKAERVQQVHEEFLGLLETCQNETDSQEVATILTILRRGAVDTTRIPGGFDPSQNMTFRIDGHYPFEDREIIRFWGRYTSETPAEGTPVCHLCGEKPAEERMPAKVKRIPGGQAAGTTLISANSEAFVSYGLKASHVGPTCRDCAERFTHALNHLLAGDDTHLMVGSQVYIFWCKGDFSPVPILRDPQPVDMVAKLSAGLPSKMAAEPDDPAVLKELLKAAWTGRKGAVEVDVEPFYAAAFSASGGRVVVRDWLETTLSAAKRNLARFFWAGMVAGGQKPLVSIHALAGSTVRDFKDLPDHVPRAIFNFALKNTPLPPALLHQAVRRNVAEQRVTHPRAALIKMYFVSNDFYITEEDDMTELNYNRTEPAYLCGRLLAVLEEIQEVSAGYNINTTIVDGFYGTASTAPAVAFPRMLSLSHHHLRKLRAKKGLHIALSKKKDAVMAGLTSFPSSLSLVEQGLFALGFSHQRTERYTKKNQPETEEE